MNKKVVLTSFLLLVLLLLANSCLFVVDQRQFAIVYGMNSKVQRVITTPGLQVKLPWPLQLVKNLDKRVIASSASSQQALQTLDKKNITIDWYVRWRITNVQQYLQYVGDTENAGKERLDQAIYTALKDIEKTSLQTLLHGKAIGPNVLTKVRSTANGTQPWGVEVLDVQIVRMGLDAQAALAIYKQMREHSQQTVDALRAAGQAQAEKIRTDADRQIQTLLDQGYRDAEKIKGQGDIEASKVYADSYAKDPQFANFYRTLAIYRRGLNNKTDVLVINPANGGLLKVIPQDAGNAADVLGASAP